MKNVKLIEFLMESNLFTSEVNINSSKISAGLNFEGGACVNRAMFIEVIENTTNDFVISGNHIIFDNN